MKTIGLIGGLSWESSIEYYRVINQEVQRRLGGVHSAQCLMWSFEFGEIEALQAAGNWDEAARRMVDAAQRVERGGADCLIICSNTMHRMATEVQAAISIPLIHIADPTGAAIQAAGIRQIALLGTRYTMEQAFYRGRLVEHFGLDVRVPDEPGRTHIHEIIYEELVRGIIRAESRQQYQQVIHTLAEAGAQGVILGCTEIGLLIKPEHSPIPTFDTTYLHALAAVNFALGD
jgi:aspartate racemase